MTFELTQDAELIKKIATDPAVFRASRDDFSATPEDWQPTMDERILYVLARDGAELLGMWIFYPESPIMMKVHTCLLPCSYGTRARVAAKEMAVWFWTNTQAERLITDVPEFNRLARKFAEAAGMKQFGINPKSFKRDGKLWDVVMLGMSRPEKVVCGNQGQSGDSVQGFAEIRE